MNRKAVHALVFAVGVAAPVQGQWEELDTIGPGPGSVIQLWSSDALQGAITFGCESLGGEWRERVQIWSARQLTRTRTTRGAVRERRSIRLTLGDSASEQVWYMDGTGAVGVYRSDTRWMIEKLAETSSGANRQVRVETHDRDGAPLSWTWVLPIDTADVLAKHSTACRAAHRA